MTKPLNTLFSILTTLVLTMSTSCQTSPTPETTPSPPSSRVVPTLNTLVPTSVPTTYYGGPATSAPDPTAKPDVTPTATTFPSTVEADVDRTLSATCAPPCWLDIWPGITTKQQARATLERYSREGIVIDWIEMEWQDCPGITLWPVDVNPHFTGATLVFELDTVDHISVDLYPFYTLGRLVDRYGPPEFVSNLNSRGICSDCRTAMSGWTPGERVDEMISLGAYYPTQGMTFSMEAPISMQGCMCPDIVVSAGFYYSPMTIDEFENLKEPSNICQAVVWKGRSGNEPVVEWHGFGPGYGTEVEIDLSIVK